MVTSCGRSEWPQEKQPKRLGVRPVMTLPRVGEQTGAAAWKLSKRKPSRASASKFGVLRPG